jgi:hypothetical protein
MPSTPFFPEGKSVPGEPGTYIAKQKRHRMAKGKVSKQ